MVFSKYKSWIIPLFLAAAIKFASLDSNWVETTYTQTIYPFISSILRTLFGWLPFSVGDIFYGSLILWLIYKTVKGIGLLVKRKATWKGTGKNFLQLVKAGLWIYIVFNVLWGINYNRKGISHQLQIAAVEKKAEELKLIDSVLLQKVNSAKLAATRQYGKYPSRKELFQKAVDAYRKAEKDWPFLHYPHPSVKNSLFGSIGNYLGYTGYYNPITAEAQVNTTVPQFFLPFTTCHEIAHQLGYAKENEANFVSFLVSSQSDDILFVYSAYLEAFFYTNNALARIDKHAAFHSSEKLIPEVRADLNEAKVFFAKHKNPVEPLIKWGYGLFLKSNQQPQGMLSYNEVTALLVGYYKKYGRL